MVDDLGREPEREYADEPEGLSGVGLSFLVAGLVSLAFLGFAGIELS